MAQDDRQDMTHDEQEVEEDLQARTDALRLLCQGAGFLNREYGEQVSQETLDLLEADDPDDLRDQIKLGLELMIPGPYRDAINNALGAYWFRDEELERSNLTERRNWFVKTQGGVSYRTLIRHEQEGAYILASMMKTASARRKTTTDELVKRIIDLERIVSWLTQAKRLPDYDALGFGEDGAQQVLRSITDVDVRAIGELERTLGKQHES